MKEIIFLFVLGQGLLGISPIGNSSSLPSPVSNYGHRLEPETFIFLSNLKRLADSIDVASLVNLNEDFDIELKRPIATTDQDALRAQQGSLLNVMKDLRRERDQLSFLVSMLILPPYDRNLTRFCNKGHLKHYSDDLTIKAICVAHKTPAKSFLIEEIVRTASDFSDLSAHEAQVSLTLREILRRTQFLNTKNIILRNNAPSLTATVVDPPILQSTTSIKADAEQATCLASLMQASIREVSLLHAMNFRPRSRKRGQLLILSQKIEAYLRDRGACPVPPQIDNCKTDTPGSRESYRKETMDKLEGIRVQLESLENATPFLPIDDWRMARNYLLTDIIGASDLNLRALTARRACESPLRRRG